MQLGAKEIWLALNAGGNDGIVDRTTGRAVALPKGNVIHFRCAAFGADPARAANLVTIFTGVLSATFVMRANGPDGNVMASKTVALEEFNQELTFDNWTGKTDQHFTITLPSEDNNFDIASGTERTVYIAFQFDTEAGPILLGKGHAVFFNDGLVDAGLPTPEVSEPPFLNMAQSDARYGRPGINVPLWRPDITALTGGGDDALDSIATSVLAAGHRVDIYLDDAVRSYVLTEGTEAEAAPGIIRPDDYHADTNAKFWKAAA